jgi:hypothetical protein
MKTLGSLISSALGRPVVTPSVYVQIGFSTPSRWTDGPTTDWNGFTWTHRDIDVRDLQAQAYTLSGTLVLGNADNVAGALATTERFMDRAITIWGYDRAAPTDAVWLCNALGGGAIVGWDEVSVALRHPCDGMVSPRSFINGPEFGSCLPDGAVIRINGIDLRIERGDN